MTGRRLAGLAAGVLLSAAAAAHAAAPAAPQAPFEGAVSAAKTAMMADPQAALARSVEALAIARREPGDTAQHVATAQWLQGEALYAMPVQKGLGYVALFGRTESGSDQGQSYMAGARYRLAF